MFFPKFQFFIFLAIKFLMITNFIPEPLATKIAIKGGCIWYLWTAKDQNSFLKVHLQKLVAISRDSNRLYQAGVKLAPARVTTSSQSPCGIGLIQVSLGVQPKALAWVSGPRVQPWCPAQGTGQEVQPGGPAWGSRARVEQG